jgi:hypothetical protein
MNPSNRYARDITLRLLLDRSILEVCKYVIVDRMRKLIFQREHFYSQVSVDEYNTIKIATKIRIVYTMPLNLFMMIYFLKIRLKTSND